MKHVVTYHTPGERSTLCATGEGYAWEMAQHNAFKRLLEFVDARESLPYKLTDFVRDETLRDERLMAWHRPSGSPPSITAQFRVAVDSVTEARKVLRELSRYDVYLGQSSVDFPEQGLLEWVEEGRDGAWLEWSDDRGNNIEDSHEGL